MQDPKPSRCFPHSVLHLCNFFFFWFYDFLLQWRLCLISFKQTDAFITPEILKLIYERLAHIFDAFWVCLSIVVSRWCPPEEAVLVQWAVCGQDSNQPSTLLRVSLKLFRRLTRFYFLHSTLCTSFIKLFFVPRPQRIKNSCIAAKLFFFFFLSTEWRFLWLFCDGLVVFAVSDHFSLTAFLHFCGKRNRLVYLRAERTRISTFRSWYSKNLCFRVTFCLWRLFKYTQITKIVFWFYNRKTFLDFYYLWKNCQEY